MTRAEHISQLKPATNYIELMQLLRTIHEQGLLLDITVFDDVTIHRLLGPGEIRTSEKKIRSGHTDVRREFFAAPDNPIKFRILIYGLVGKYHSGSIYVDNRDLKNLLPFRCELVETHLLPGVEGYNPYDPTQDMPEELRNFIGGLPLATHPKGYWNYWDDKTNLGYRKHRTLVNLSRNAEITEIEIEQDNGHEGLLNCPWNELTPKFG